MWDWVCDRCDSMRVIRIHEWIIVINPWISVVSRAVQCRTPSNALAGQLRQAHRGQEKQMMRRKISCDLAGVFRFFCFFCVVSIVSLFSKYVEIFHAWTRSTWNNNSTGFSPGKVFLSNDVMGKMVRLDQIARALLEQKLHAIIKAQKKGGISDIVASATLVDITQPAPLTPLETKSFTPSRTYYVELCRGWIICGAFLLHTVRVPWCPKMVNAWTSQNIENIQIVQARVESPCKIQSVKGMPGQRWLVVLVR